MKKFAALLLSALLACSTASAAGNPDLTACAIANGVVSAVHHADITAPYSGTLLPFDWEVGDTVSAGQPLFSLMTTTIYAPEDGTVSALFIAPGDDATAVCARYGCALTIEPTHLLLVEASTKGGNSDNKNHTIHTGETVYPSKDANTDGMGRVVAVQGGSYVVELTEGNLAQDQAVTIYRDEEHTAKNSIGKGLVTRRDDAAVQGAGRVMDVLVKEGDTVKAGDPLFTLLAPDADPDAVPTLTAPNAGVLAALPMNPGQQVWKGALLCRLYLTDELEVIASVDEVDMKNLRVGDRVQVTLDTDESRILTGIVTEISGLGTTRANAAYFNVHVSLPDGVGKIGNSASVYLEK